MGLSAGGNGTLGPRVYKVCAGNNLHNIFVGYRFLLIGQLDDLGINTVQIFTFQNIAMFLKLFAQGKADRKSTRLNSSHVAISYAVFCLKKKKKVNIYEHDSL